MTQFPQDWPEPVIRVQSVSESGDPAIPTCYVKPATERPILRDSSDGETANFPLVDMGKYLNGEDGDTLSRIDEACLEWGFFQVVNHGVSPELMDRAREVWREFFHLPMEAKQAYANSPKTYEGYGSRLGVEKGTVLDWSDYYFLHYLPPQLMDHKKWPSLPVSCWEVVEEYGREVLKLCGVIMKALSVNLGLGEGQLQDAFGGEDIGACLRVNFYPKCPQPELTLGLSSHSDPGGLTVLLPDTDVQGLQVRKDGDWVTVNPAPDAFIINIGDQIQVLSNGQYKSVEHRVVVNSAQERLSLAFFYNPKSDIPIEPMRQLVTSDRPANYAPMTFDEYRRFIRLRGPRGKSQVSSLNAASSS